MAKFFHVIYSTIFKLLLIVDKTKRDFLKLIFNCFIIIKINNYNIF